MVIRLFKPKHIDVGWTCWTSSLRDSNWRETVTDRPKKVSGPKLAQGDVRYCPAFNNFYKRRIFMMRFYEAKEAAQNMEIFKYLEHDKNDILPVYVLKEKTSN